MMRILNKHLANPQMGSDDLKSLHTANINPRSGHIFQELFTQLYHLPLDSKYFTDSTRLSLWICNVRLGK